MVCLTAALILVGCSDEQSQEPAQATAVPSPTTALVDEARVVDVEENEPGAWLTFGRTYEEQRFSPLTEINRETVSDLGIVWYKDLNDYHPFQGTPLVIDGAQQALDRRRNTHTVDVASDKVRLQRKRGVEYDGGQEFPGLTPDEEVKANQALIMEQLQSMAQQKADPYLY